MYKPKPNVHFLVRADCCRLTLTLTLAFSDRNAQPNFPQGRACDPVQELTVLLLALAGVQGARLEDWRSRTVYQVGEAVASWIGRKDPGSATASDMHAIPLVPTLHLAGNQLPCCSEDKPLR